MKTVQPQPTAAATLQRKTATAPRQAAGMFGSVGTFVQPKLTVGQPNDPLEREADEAASQVMLQRQVSLGAGTLPTPPDDDTLPRKCANCEAEEQGLHPETAGNSPTTAPDGIENQLAQTKGGGSPLPAATRQQMEGSFGSDLSQVRVHTGTSAAQMSQNLNAHAFTQGNDIYFNQGQYSPQSAGGQRLLAHELTHTIQQGGGLARKVIQRQCDPTISSCMPDPATTTAPSCDPTIASCPPPTASLSNPLNIIPGTGAGSFRLIPINNPPATLLADIPEGGISTYSATPVPSSIEGVIPSISPYEFLGGGSSSLLTAINQSLMRTGFASVSGGNGIGFIAIPRLWSQAGATVPESLSTWGHTAIYVRINGQITIVRGFTVESLQQAMRYSQAITSGEQAVAGTIANDSALFTITNARTVEWPVGADAAQRMANSLPESGAPPITGPTQYTGRPGVYGPGATNCVGWACNAAADSIGGQPTTPRLGPVAEPANAAEGLQGRMMQLSKTAASDISPGGAVVSGMPLRFQILKWGGRLFMVAGAAMTVHQVVTASGEHRREQQGQAFGSFAGGVSLGAFAGGFCVGAGIATGGLALLACAGIAGIAGAVGGHYAGGAVGRQFD